MPIWDDLYRIFTYSDEKDPLSKKSDMDDVTGAGHVNPEALRFSGSNGGTTSFRQSNDMIDVTTLNNRTQRYKEYDMLRNIAEIEQAMTVISDEACIAGDTPIATPFGNQSIESLAKTKNPDERFLVYCWNFEKNDFTLGWAWNPRKVKKAQTIKVILDDGTFFVVTPDHRILRKDEEWTEAGDLKFGDELMAFYRMQAKQSLTKLKTNQFPRIYSHNRGWVHERMFVDEWRKGKVSLEIRKIRKAMRLIAQGMPVKEVADMIGHDWQTLESWINKEGFSVKELRWLNKKEKYRRVIGIVPGPEIDVYDLSVEEHMCFCTDNVVMHNCQKDDDGNVFQIECENEKVEKELKFLLLNRRMLNLNSRARIWFKNLCVNGDWFVELALKPSDPKKGIFKALALPPESMYRIETTKGRLVEFQQSMEGPDYDAIKKMPVEQASEDELKTQKAIRFAPGQVIHFRLGDDRKTFYPYGQSLIEPARGPAHQLRLMEDAMVTYRLSRAPERRVFYIDVGQLPPFKAEAFIDRMQDQFRKRKINSGLSGANAVDERWQPPAQDEDYWLPVRSGDTVTRIDTLPGACLSLDTKIPLLDGRILELNDIIKEFNEGKSLWAYSCNPNNGEFVPGNITWAGITRKNTSVVKIKLDNGKEIICTPDHKFPIIGKGYVKAEDLFVGESLIPFNTRESKIRETHNSSYEQVYDVKTKKWKFTHRAIMKFFENNGFRNEYVFEESSDNMNTIHHKDFNRYNNTPENLCWMNNVDHMKLHEWLSNEYSKMGGIARANQLKKWQKEGDPRYDIFIEKTKKIFSQWRNEISEEKRQEVNRKISSGIKKYLNSLNKDQLKSRAKILQKMSKKGFEKLSLLLQDKEFNAFFCNRIKEGWDKFRETEDFKERSKKISESNKSRWSNEEYKRNITKKQTLVFPKELLDIVHRLTDSGLSKKEICLKLREKEITNLWKESNKHIKRDIDFVFNLWHFDKMLKQHGYKNWKQFKEEGSLYNHKIVSVEMLEQKMDVGTLTIDGNDVLHGCHTFALDAGVYTKNSNLGEIDDAVYFRNKVFTALNFPANYLSSEDASTTRITLSAQNIKFAQAIERLQEQFLDGIWDICERHLKLRGFPEEMWETLTIKMTPPSDWREMSRQEVIQARLSNASQIMTNQMMALSDIYTKWLHYTEEETEEMVAKLKLQKLEDLKLQVLAQNPTLLGLGIPGDEENQGEELGAEPGGPNSNPMGQDMGGDQDMGQGQGDESGPSNPADQPIGGGSSNPYSGGQNQGPAKPEAIPLPEPSDEDIKKYDMGIEDFESEQDYEDIDYSTEE